MINAPSLFLIGLVALGGCASESADMAPDPDGTVAIDGAIPMDTTPAGPMPEAEAPAEDTGFTLLTAEGLGPIRVGMTRDEVVEVAGPDANPDAIGGMEPEMCDVFRPDRTPEGTIVMLEQNEVSRVSIGNGSPVRTPEGFGVGDPASEILAAYGDRAEAEPHKYVAAPGQYINVFRGEGDAFRGIRYEIGEDGRVTRVHGGGSSIRYVEGCS